MDDLPSEDSSKYEDTSKQKSTKPKPRNASQYERSAPSSPFKNMRISKYDHLNLLEGRQICEKCNGKRKYFCYTCYTPLGPNANLTPHITLPIICDVVHYNTEAAGKSTAVHAKIVAPESVCVYTFPGDLYDWNPEETVLLFPSEDASDVKDLDFAKLKRVVFVECQWHNANKILGDSRVQRLKHVKIQNYETLFWRWQNVGNECLATIEAIYYFYKEFVTAKQNGEYHGEVDDLMYYFAFFYELVQGKYHESGRKFRRIPGYITESESSDSTYDNPPESANTPNHNTDT